MRAVLDWSDGYHFIEVGLYPSERMLPDMGYEFSHASESAVLWPSLIRWGFGPDPQPKQEPMDFEWTSAGATDVPEEQFKNKR